jgi:2-methylisocitrate lyase-like PEP mutase family enzyme
MTTGPTTLRRLLAEGRLILAPFIYDAFTAKIGESAGFPCLYMSGFGTSMARGYPDVGLVTQTEMAENARAVARTVSVPVIADADTGYGNPVNVWRTVREYEAAGVAGLHIEDQVFPKRCGFFAGKDVIPREEAVQKVRAAVEARTNPDFVIIARCDALAVAGWEETERRCRAYMAAGAHMVFVDGIRTLDDLREYARRLGDLPRLYNGDTLASEVERLGFKVQIHRGSIYAVYRAARAAMEELRKTGQISPERMGDSSQVRMEIANLLGLERITEMEQRYAAATGSRA